MGKKHKSDSSKKNELSRLSPDEQYHHIKRHKNKKSRKEKRRSPLPPLPPPAPPNAYVSTSMMVAAASVAGLSSSKK
uniref:Uncharacterized protein n=1 Tax=Romanomermis culicivorax TaxID=13658 RepID=A0A915J1A5_ROMCU